MKDFRKNQKYSGDQAYHTIGIFKPLRGKLKCTKRTTVLKFASPSNREKSKIVDLDAGEYYILDTKLKPSETDIESYVKVWVQEDNPDYVE